VHSSADELELLTEQVDKYLAMSLQIRTGDPLVWWREHATDLPQLARFARKYLATPSSSVYSEGLFSEYGNIYEEKRSRLLPRRSCSFITTRARWRKRS
jgi:hAT family C-terminal dimerisation region